MNAARLAASSIALAALALSSCVLGPPADPLRPVDIENATALQLRVYQDGATRRLPLDISAHGVARTAFAWPIDPSDGRVRVVLAEDPSGRRVYCESFTYKDLLAVHWKIRITEKDACAPGP